MKKRLLSLVLCLVMVFSLFPAFAAPAHAEDGDDGYVSVGTKTGSEIAAWNKNSVEPAAADDHLYVHVGNYYFPVTAEQRNSYTMVQKFYANGTANGTETFIKFKHNSDWDAFPMPPEPDNKEFREGFSTNYYVLDAFGSPRPLMFDYEFHSGGWSYDKYYEYLPYYIDSHGNREDLYADDDSSVISSYYANTLNESSNNENDYSNHRTANHKWSGYYCVSNTRYNGLRIDLYEMQPTGTGYNYIYYSKPNGRTFDLVDDQQQVNPQCPVELFYKAETTTPSDEPIIDDEVALTKTGNGLTAVKDLGGMHMEKTLIPNEDGTFSVELQAFATGTYTSTTSSKAVPTDIVLVLDQSLSMIQNNITISNNQYVHVDSVSYEEIKGGTYQYFIRLADGYHLLDTRRSGWFDHSYFIWYDDEQEDHYLLKDSDDHEISMPNLYYMEAAGTKTYLEALQDATRLFVDSVASQVDEYGDPINRVAIVGFASSGRQYNDSPYEETEIFNGSTQYGYSDVTGDTSVRYDELALKWTDEDGVSDLKASIESLDATGGTFANLGFELAYRILNDRPAKEKAERNTVVVFFTDGDSSGDRDTVYARAHDLKEQFGATVFSVGIFTNETDARKNYMELVSSQYPDAVSGSNTGARAPEPPSYYTRTDGTSNTLPLSEIFKNITENIEDASTPVKLEVGAYLRDVIDTENFDTKNISASVKTQVGTQNSATGTWDDIDWGTVDNNCGLTADKTTEPGSVLVTGFDYAANYIGYGKDSGSSTANQGKKLIVRIDGLVPLQKEDPDADNPIEGQSGKVLPSNTSAGVYENETAMQQNKPTIQVDRPWTTIGETNIVIDYNVPVTLTSHLSDAKAPVRINNRAFTEQGKSGTYTKSGNTLTYELFTGDVNKKLSGEGATLKGDVNLGAYGGVDSALFFEKTNDTTYGWKQVNTLPATSVYYSDALTGEQVTNPVVIDENSKGDGFNANAVTGAVRFDSDTQGKQIYYTFRGTGIDVYSSTVPNAKGYILAQILKYDDVKEDYTVVKSQSMKNISADNRVNVPSIFFDDLPYDTYQLRLYVAKGLDYNIDGIRVYNPAGIGVDETAEAIYAKNSERNATFTNLHDMLLKKGEGMFEKGGIFSDAQADEGSTQKTITVPKLDENGKKQYDKDGKLITDVIAYAPLTLKAYEIDGPKNEIYLDAGDAIAFTITNWNDQEIQAQNLKLMIGISVVQGDSATFATNRTAQDENATQVDQYYDVTPVGDGNKVLVKNTSAEKGTLISVTNLKVSGGSEPYEVTAQGNAQPLAVTDEAEPNVLYIDINEETEAYAAEFNGMRLLADIEAKAAEAEQSGEVDPQPTETPETPEPTQQPSVQDMVKQILSSFVDLLFKSIARIFGH